MVAAGDLALLQKEKGPTLEALGGGIVKVGKADGEGKGRRGGTGRAPDFLLAQLSSDKDKGSCNS